MVAGERPERGAVPSLVRDDVPADEEAHFLIESRSLMGRGIGYIDVHLLASTLLNDEPALWTRDKRLAAIANELSVLYEPEVP